MFRVQGLGFKGLGPKGLQKGFRTVLFLFCKGSIRETLNPKPYLFCKGSRRVKKPSKVP